MSEEPQVLSPAHEATSGEGNAPEKSVDIIVYPSDPKLFVVRYERDDFDGLYRQFEEKLRKLKIPRSQVYYQNEAGELVHVKNRFDISVMASLGKNVSLYESKEDTHKKGSQKKEKGRHFVSFTVRHECAPEFEITYNDNDDLFAKLKEELQKRNVSIDDLWCIDGDYRAKRANDPEVIKERTEWTNVITLHSKKVVDDCLAWESVYEPPRPAPQKKQKGEDDRSSCSSSGGSSHRQRRSRTAHHHPPFDRCHPPFGVHCCSMNRPAFDFYPAFPFHHHGYCGSCC